MDFILKSVEKSIVQLAHSCQTPILLMIESKETGDSCFHLCESLSMASLLEIQKEVNSEINSRKIKMN